MSREFKVDRGWRKTSIDIEPELLRDINKYCIERNVTKTQIINSMFIALVLGDLQIPYDINREIRPKFSVMRTVDDYVKVDLYMKNKTTLLNPSTYHDRLNNDSYIEVFSTDDIL